MTTKILALTDALGNLVRFELLPGHRFDTVGVEPLVKDVEFDGLTLTSVGPKSSSPSIPAVRSHCLWIESFISGDT